MIMMMVVVVVIQARLSDGDGLRLSDGRDASLYGDGGRGRLW